MKIAVTGSAGLIGSHLTVALAQAGHEVLSLVRRPPRQPGEVQWDPARGVLEPSAIVGIDAAVNLAGAGIGDKRWTDSYKKLVLDSRVDSTRLLATTMAALDPLPSVLLSGSAVGYYGNTGSHVVDEQAGAGDGFLAELCTRWEAQTTPAQTAGIRVAHLRTGIVLARHGGALAKQLPLFKVGLGGPLGGGQQYQSWISLADEVSAIMFLLRTDVRGPVNLTAPNAVPQKEFAAILGSVLHRPALLPAPGFAIRLALGEFASEGVLTGQRVAPKVLSAAGFPFAHPTLHAALRAELE